MSRILEDPSACTMIFKPLAASIPGLALKAIGRYPHTELLSFSSMDVDVTGEVGDLWAAMSGMTIFLFPMDIGAGLQNKILEAMYLAKPVITTTVCSSSLGPLDGRALSAGGFRCSVARGDPEINWQPGSCLADRALGTRICSENLRSGCDSARL